jgi:hypothetical protein
MIGSKQNKQALIWRIDGLPEIIPDLTMLINPQNLDISYMPLITETRTLGGFIQEFWGDQLTSISAAGRTAMFYSDTGITVAEAKASEAYHNFIRLVNIYKNNGKVYTASATNVNRISAVGVVILTYAERQYEGFFDSFEIKELPDRPFTLDYDFTFKVLRMLGHIVIQNGNFVRVTK